MNSNLKGKEFSPISYVNNSTDVENSQKNYDNNYNINLFQDNVNTLNNKNNFHSIVNNENIIKNKTSTINLDNEILKPSPLLITNNFNMNFKLNSSNILPFYFNSQIQEQIKKEEKAKKKYFCNCKKTKCLKLYCECFANGEYCIDCNCDQCSNTFGNENEIQKNYNEVKDKNPVALKLNLFSKNNETSVGCNCTKSNCSKKYCECYKLKKKCGEFCRCRDCYNVIKDNKVKKIILNKNKINLKNLYDDYVFQKIHILIDKNNINIETIDNIKNLNDNDNKIIVRVINHQQIIEIPKALIDKNTLINFKNMLNNNKINNDITLIENNFNQNKNINILNGIYQLNKINNNLFEKHIKNKQNEDKSIFNKEIINELTNKKRYNPNKILGKN